MTTPTTTGGARGAGGSDGGDGRPMLGRYALVREIARSNDVVYEGLDTTMGRRVAVKELALDATLTGQPRRDRIERFFREARAAGAMNHPNIVTIHEVAEDRGRFFIAMEFLEGQTLRERLSVAGALSLAEAVNVTSSLCDALDYAHQRGVVHRDIKPDNVHILHGGQVKLTDFGIARILTEQQLTVAGQIFGTPSYMSPEQVLGAPIDARSDIFSLGVLLYEMLTGRKPFLGDTVVTITYKIMNEPTPPAQGVPAEVEAVLRRAMGKTPDERFRSAAEFKAALHHAAAPYRTGGHAAHAFAAAATSAAAPPPPMAAMPQQTPSGAPLGATVAYGAQTQQAAFGGAPVPPPPPVTDYAPPAGGYGGATSYPAYPEPHRSVAGPVAVVLILLAILGVTGYGLSLAMKNVARQQTVNRYEEAYKAAAKLYEGGDFTGAAAAFGRIRGARDAAPDAARRALVGELYSYRRLGQDAQKRSDFATAETWFQKAYDLDPNDAATRSELDAVRRARGAQAGVAPAARQGQQGGGTAGNDPNNPLSGVLARRGPTDPPAGGAPSSPGGLSSPTAPELPAASGADFQAANARRAAEAQQYLQQGNQAAQGGNMDTALAYWRKAVEVGPGTQPALQAQQLVTRYSARDPLGEQ